MSEVLKKFGRYFLLDHIAQGGMAEIYRARLASVDGAGRLIVIKKVISGFGANKEFLQMFKSEIKVTMGFNHPNIVQLYDFGEEQNQPYIAMEMVDGKNLRQLISRFHELKQTFPVELAAYITEQAASGLHYAHSFKDKISGIPLNIVHRDISPQNILISFEGNVKVIDFGIAKATTNMESTRAGVIKGKPSYLSPEQISGEVLDGRSDIFALGAVLWELLTGKKLFAGENDLAVLKLIESCQTHVKPPSTLNPKIPKELDYIVLKTLAKQRDKRYQSAEELQRALHKFLYSYSPDFNPSDLSYYAKDLFKNEIVEDRKKIQKLNDKVEQLLALDIPETPVPTEESDSKPEKVSQKREDETTVVDRTKATGSREAFSPSAAKDAKDGAKEAKIEMDIPPPDKRKGPDYNRSKSTATTASTVRPNHAGEFRSNAPQRRPAPTPKATPIGNGKLAGIAVAALIALSVFGPEFGVKVPILTDLLGDWVGGSEARLVLEGNLKAVTVAINGQTVASNVPTTLTGIPVGTPFRVTVMGAGGSFQQELTLRKGEKKAISVILTADKPPSPTTLADNQTAQQPPLPDKSVYLRLNITPAGGSPVVMVSGKSVDINNPVIAVSLDAPLELSVDKTGYKPFKREFVLDSHQVGNLKEWLMDVPLEPSRFGFLTIHTTPSADATIILDGTPWKRKTPIENEKLPVGDYSVRLTNDVLGMEKVVTVNVEEGKSVNIEERLEIKN